MVMAQMDAGSSQCGVSCKSWAGVADKILTRENIYACVFV